MAGWLLPIRLVFGLLIFIGIRLLGLLLALAQQFLDQGLVLGRLLQLRIDFQGPFVGVYGCFQLVTAGQGVAAVIERGRAVILGELFGRRRVVACFIERQATPVRVLEALGGLLGAPGFCLLYTSPSPRDVEESRMPSSA